MADRRPLLVRRPDGRPYELLEQNEKGYRKTIEQGALWALHHATGRLLPCYAGLRVTIVDKASWYDATLAEEPIAPAKSSAQAEGAAPEAGGAAPEAASGTADSGQAAPDDLGRVIAGLAALIAERRAELPAGSYTTHLFTSGAEKIRKKVGEEAVELLLASTRETIVSESADLLYHLLVLLESEGIKISEIAAELRRR